MTLENNWQQGTHGCVMGRVFEGAQGYEEQGALLWGDVEQGLCGCGSSAGGSKSWVGWPRRAETCTPSAQPQSARFLSLTYSRVSFGVNTEG